jgi:uncharacterized membrane protein
MSTQFKSWIHETWQVLSLSHNLIAWNLFLAFVPLVLSIYLFRRSRSRSLLWWISLLVFIAFLPNAPYVLTDIIHLIELIRRGYSVWTVTLVLIPQYLLFIFLGFEAYVISLINLGYYLQRIGREKYIVETELFSHFICAIGVFLGRFLRFNSWDLVTQTDYLLASVIGDLANKWAVLVIIITFAVITILYWIMKEVTLGITLRLGFSKSK